ncbi:MAG: ATP-dependent zinc metalloprotease FtsH [Deltaproteobacteria bacterium]|nr:ATP-dependent zinc metalloprotease FtsH [Deltaproteobacteria bacterium]MBI3294479.1 ATP-dependent zinc metalloprotease FtsH [Deltaproteobacteria bacterium]
MKSSQKTVLGWLALTVMALILFHSARAPMPMARIPFNKFIEHVKLGHIDNVTFRNHGHIEGKYAAGFENGAAFETVGDTTSEFYVKLLNEKGLVPNYDIDDENTGLSHILLSLAPMLIIFAVLLFFLRQIQVSGGKAMQFGRSRAKLLTEGHTKVTFNDVAGCDEAKEELKEIVDFLRDPKKFTRLGGRIPKGVLLVGSPGTGKTLLAKAVAGEAVVPFFSISGSDFVEMFVGVGASRVRDLFEQGKKHAPCIIFIDEIDAVGRQRGAGLGGGHDEREQTLNQLLVEMDGFDSKEGVILVAATNRPDVLDPALLRPGRFDRNVVVSKPDVRGREGILKVHVRKIPLAKDVDLTVVARGTPGFSGADLQNLVNEAALLAARKNLSVVSHHEMEQAKDKVLMGTERKSMFIGAEEKRAVAYHESGHTIVGKFLKQIDPIHKVTIIPRGMALGLTQTLPSEDRLTLSKEKAENMIAFLMGGCIAESIVLGQQTTGAGNDIERATDLARRMVCEWGMSEAIGPVAIAKKEENVFLGREISQSLTVSQRTAEIVDSEIHRIITTNYNRAVQILKTNIDILHRMSAALLERETLDMQEIEMVVQGKTLPPFEPAKPVVGADAVKPVEVPVVNPFPKTNTEVA